MVRDILVVYKKNFEAVHDIALESVKKTLDNLVKGAAGQAVQNMNIVFRLKENLGLI